MIRYIVLPHLNIHNANAHSSPYTIGFPAVTSWLGFTHYLQREIQKIDEYKNVRFNGVGIIAHDVKLRTHQQRSSFANPLFGMAFPIDKTEKRAPFIEEAKCSLEVSLVIETEEFPVNLREEILETLNLIIIKGTKIAGGDIISMCGAKVISGDEERRFSLIKKEVTPGYVLIERRELIINDMQEGMDAFDSLLSYMEVCHKCNDTEPFQWKTEKKELGWLVPIAVGYKQISDQFSCDMQRDKTIPHMFVESIVTLGEFIMPHRLQSIEDLFWRYRYDETEGLYLCENKLKEFDYGKN